MNPSVLPSENPLGIQRIGDQLFGQVTSPFLLSQYFSNQESPSSGSKSETRRELEIPAWLPADFLSGLPAQMCSGA